MTDEKPCTQVNVAKPYLLSIFIRGVGLQMVFCDVIQPVLRKFAILVHRVSFPPPPKTGAGAGVAVGMLRGGGGSPFIENVNNYKFQSFQASKLQSFRIAKTSTFQIVNSQVSKFQMSEVTKTDTPIS